MPGSRSLFRVLVPFGSRRDRFVWIAFVTVRKLREGPGPWLRAVKKGVYQLLPPAWQQRLLRWSGDDEFFRRAPAPAVASGDSVVVPGLVSVVLPVFDQASMVAESVRSVLAQTHRELELIVVDDGSRDSVLDVLRPFLRDPRVRLLTQPNQGLPKALSTGFEHARGEFFTWTSADNLMHERQLERLLAFLRARPEVAMVYADYEVIGPDGTPLVGGEFRVMDRTDPNNPAAVRLKRATHDLNRYEDNFVGACFLYRAAVGRLLGDYNPELGLEDYDYWMRINRLFRLEHLGTDELLYRYRVHDNTLSARARELRILERARVLMANERQRAAWCQAPLAIVADASQRTWLEPRLDADETLLELESLTAWPEQKVLLAVDASTAAALRPAESPLPWPPPPNVAVALHCSDPATAHRAHAALRDLPALAFTADPATALRLAVHTRTVFELPPGDDTLALLRRFAANTTFFRTTRDPERLQRVVPTPVQRREPLAVLLQVDTFGTGGLERVVFDLAIALRQQGCRVGLCAIDGRLDGPLPAQLQAAGVEFPRLSARDAAGYAELLTHGNWTTVSAHASTFGADVAAARGVPFVQVVHNSYVWFDRETIERYRTADAHTQAYACVSAEALAYADLRLGLDVRKAVVIENGIDLAAARAVPLEQRAELRRAHGFDDDAFVFLQVASLQPAKAHRIALHALARLRQQRPEARLVCLGHTMNPLHAATLRQDVAALGLEQAVVFAGHHDDPRPLYALADALLLPSFWEGCSLAVWEALAAGLPLVLSDVGAARQQLRCGRGEVIAPPFDSLLSIDATNVDALVHAVDEPFVTRTATAMQRVLVATRGCERTAAPLLPPLADRATMARRHRLLLTWLAGGGAVAGIRCSLARAGGM